MEKIKFKTREQWLTAAAKKLERLFPADQKPSGYRVTCGFPSTGGIANKQRVVGECWPKGASKDRINEVILTILEDAPLEVMGTLAHELVHVVDDCQHGHKAPFRKLATEIGLEGKMTSTTMSERFKDEARKMIKALGPYPHKALRTAGRTKQGTRMIKAACPECGYTVRTTQKWIDIAIPCCPVDNAEMEVG